MFADQIFYNGKIYTMDVKNSVVDSLACKDGKIVAAGASAEAFKGPDTQMVDLKGRTVLPGIEDCHTHFYGIGKSLLGLDLKDMTKEEILHCVAEVSSRMPPGEWIIGNGWNNALFVGGRYPGREELDAVSQGHPALLIRYCGNGFWANSLALEAAGIDRNTPDPEGEILKDENGDPTGILSGFAAKRITGILPEYGDEMYRKMLVDAQRELLSWGITSVMDEGAGVTSAMGDGDGRRFVQVLRSLYEEGVMKLRFYENVCAVQTDFYEDTLKNGPVIGAYDDRFDFRGVKIWTDGAMGMRTAWIPEGYKDDPVNFGQPHYTHEQLKALLQKNDEAGFQTTIHAIGNGACKQILDCYEELFKNDGKDRRFKLEHFHLADPEDIDRLVADGIINSTQFIQYADDLEIAGDAIGTEMFAHCYAWRQILDKGGIVCGGADSTYSALNPFPALFVAVTRTDLKGKNEQDPSYQQGTLSREEALRAYTTSAAFAQFKDAVKGSLEFGKYADFIVLDRDYFTCPAEEIKDICVLRTVIGAETVWQA